MLGESRSAEMQEYIGLTPFELKEYIGSKMLPGMNWNNYGEVWVVEHVVSLLYFDLSSKEDRKLAWSPMNLMPLFREHMRHKEGNLHFAKELLELAPSCDTRDRLLSIVLENLKILDKYEMAYLKGKYYKED